MKYLLLLSLFSTITFAQAPKPPLEELFKDVPLAQRQDKRVELALKMASDKNDTGYHRDLTPVLYALNLKENPKHGISWFYLVNKIFSQGSVERFELTSEASLKADQLITEGLRNIPDYAPLLVHRAFLDIVMKKDKETVRQNAIRISEYATDMNLHVLSAFGKVLSFFKENDKAANVYKLMDAKAATQEERNDALFARGFGAQIAENHQGCVDAFSRLRAIRKNYGEDVGLISCLNSLKRFDEALAIGNEYRNTFGQGGAMDCHLATSNSGKGFSLYESGNHSTAESYLIEGVKGCTNSNRFTNLAYNYIKLNNLEKAKETILAGAKVHSGDKAAYLSGWSTYFKDNNEFKLFFLDEAFKQISKPSERVNAYLAQMHRMIDAKDPAQAEYSRKNLILAAEMYDANRNDFDFVKNYGLLNAIFGINRDSLIYLAKAKEILAHAKSLKPESDNHIEQYLARVAQIESGIHAGTIKPSEP